MGISQRQQDCKTCFRLWHLGLQMIKSSFKQKYYLYTQKNLFVRGKGSTQAFSICSFSISMNLFLMGELSTVKLRYNSHR